MSILFCRSLDIEVAGSTLLKNITFRLEQGEKAGLIGANGAGKTTLIRAIVGEISYAKGEIRCSGTRGYLPQAPEGESLLGNVFEAMLAERKDILDMRSDLRFLEIRMAQEADVKILEQYSYLTTQYELAGGYSLEAQVKRILVGLGLELEQAKEISYLSGGQKTRLALAKLLLREPDLLILDEPTNHLDIEALEWLESYLAEYKGAVLLVSHDRYFLDRIVGRIFFIQDGKLEPYAGNYSEFELQRTVEEITLVREADKVNKKIAALEEYIRRHGAGIKAKQARGRETQLNKINPVTAAPSAKSLQFKLQTQIRAGDRVMDIADLAIEYGRKEIFRNVSFELRRGDKIALLGKNGVGKTSLFKAVMGRVPYKGMIKAGANVRIAYYSQEHEDIGIRENVIDEIRSSSNLDDLQIRNLLAGFGFRGDEVFKPIRILSGGERSRLALCKLFLAEGNLLLLDEPTNHLDMDTREVLEDVLQNYNGTILTVSHDRYFLNKVVNKIALLTPRGLRIIEGDYTTYRELIEQEHELLKENLSLQIERESPAAKSYQEESRNNRRKEKKLKQMEEKIAATEALLKEIEKELEAVGDDYEQALSYHQQLEDVHKEYDELLSAWVETTD